MFLSRNIVVKRNNNCEKRGGERGFFLFFFSSPQFNMQSEISRKNLFVPWGISKVIISTKHPIQRKAYYKVRQLVITKCNSLVYYKVRQLVITKGDSYFITKCDKCYYKVRQVLQSAMIITKCNRTPVFSFNRRMNATDAKCERCTCQN